LAVTIAQSGKKTLLVDADLRKSRIHKIFSLSSEVGLASVLGQGVEVADAVQESSIADLTLLPAGPPPPDPSELLTSPRFAELLDLLREKYEYVVIDTPPILPVTDACVVAPRVDGVLLMIRISKHGRPLAERAKDILNGVGAKLAGIIVNAIDEDKSRASGYGSYGYSYAGYGYGGYGYGGYGYGGYGYGSYGYGDDEAEDGGGAKDADEAKEHSGKSRHRQKTNGRPRKEATS
jgi:capsular exopolysaccharide synthesis family protein